MNPVTETNCIDLRRAKLADPVHLPEAARRHLDECAPCQSFSRRVDLNEDRIRRALEVPVPEGLDDRLMLAVRSRRALPWRAWAMAATVVLSVGAGMSMFLRSGTPDPARFAIEHVLHEPESFTSERLADNAEFRNVVAHFGGELQGSLGKVRYMKLCPGPEGVGWHVVLETEHGLVTLFLIPSEGKAKPSETTMKGFDSMAVPGGRGYYAIVASDEKAMTAFAATVKQNIRWRI